MNALYAVWGVEASGKQHAWIASLMLAAVPATWRVAAHL